MKPLIKWEWKMEKWSRLLTWLEMLGKLSEYMKVLGSSGVWKRVSI